jgi:hypothetical protein
MSDQFRTRMDLRHVFMGALGPLIGGELGEGAAIVSLPPQAAGPVAGAPVRGLDGRFAVPALDCSEALAVTMQ